MYFYKINNLTSASGACYYKGLNTDLFIAGTQVYPHDLQENNMCLVASTENLLTNGDLTKITEEEYITLRQEILGAYPAPQPSAEERLALLEQAMNDMLLGGM